MKYGRLFRVFLGIGDPEPAFVQLVYGDADRLAVVEHILVADELARALRRATRRLVPWLSAAGGVGATLGAALVVPLAGRGGTTAVMLVAAAAMGGAALLAARLDPARRVAARSGRRRGRWSAPPARRRSG